MEVKYFSNTSFNYYFKFTIRVICFFILIAAIMLSQTGVDADAAKATSGQDENGNVWNYDTTTKTLTFSRNKDIEDNASMDGHSVEPGWYHWEKETEHLIIEEGITGIGDGAFYDFTNTSTVEMGDSVTYIGVMAFEGCWRMKHIKLSENIVKIDDYALSDCGLKTIVIPNIVKLIGNAFGGCRELNTVEMSDNVVKINAYAFADCYKLTKIRLSSNLVCIKESLFRNCKNLKSVKVPSKVTSVTMSAFSGTGIKKIILPKNVRVIKKGKPIGGKVFSTNKKLKQIVIHSKKVKSISKGSFSGLKETCTIRVPKSRCKKYRKMLLKSGMSKKIKVKAIVS